MMTPPDEHYELKKKLIQETAMYITRQWREDYRSLIRKFLPLFEELYPQNRMTKQEAMKAVFKEKQMLAA